jgi:hypothetical protein
MVVRHPPVLDITGIQIAHRSGIQRISGRIPDQSRRIITKFSE